MNYMVMLEMKEKPNSDKFVGLNYLEVVPRHDLRGLDRLGMGGITIYTYTI